MTEAFFGKCAAHIFQICHWCDCLFLHGEESGVMDRRVPPPRQTSQDVTCWTPDQREGKLWRWRERGGAPDVTSAATTPKGPAGHGNLTCPLPKICSFPPTPSHSISAVRLPAWCLLCLALMAFSPTFFPPPLSYGLLLPNLCLFLPVFLLCCVLWCGFTLALTLPKAKISSLTLPWYIMHSEQKHLCNRNVEVSFYKLNFFNIHSEQKCVCSRNVEDFFSIRKRQADGRLMKHDHTL